MSKRHGEKSPHLVIRVRLYTGGDIALGPGKADLLEAIRKTGSISAAGRALGLSYRRAWQLVETMNRSFCKPVVEAARGGEHGGGAVVTPFGWDLLTDYRALEKDLEKTAGRHFDRLSQNLKTEIAESK